MTVAKLTIEKTDNGMRMAATLIDLNNDEVKAFYVSAFYTLLSGISENMHADGEENANEDMNDLTVLFALAGISSFLDDQQIDVGIVQFIDNLVNKVHEAYGTEKGGKKCTRLH